MKSNIGFNQTVRKNTVQHQEQKHAIPTLNLNNFGNIRYERKINQEKSSEKNTINESRTDHKTKQKKELKKQLNIIMHDAKIRKAFSPSSISGKCSQDLSLQNKSYKKTISPHNSSKISTYKIKARQGLHEKKKSNADLEADKKAPTWLNKKGKSEINLIGNKSGVKWQKEKSRECKESCPSIQIKCKKECKLSNLQQKQYEMEKVKSAKSFSNIGKDWIKCSYETLNKNDDIKNSILVGSNMEINKIILQKERTEMKFQLQNALEDKNILINRIQSLEMELAVCKKKVEEWKQVEGNYRHNQKVLKQTISELQGKLISTRQSKSKEVSMEAGKFYSEGLCERQIFAKKNEQISRLNEMIKSNRYKVAEMNSELSMERIKHIKTIQSLEQKFSDTFQEKIRQIDGLKEQIQRYKIQNDRMRHELQGKNKIIKEHLLHQVSKQQDSTNVHSFVQKYNIQEINGYLFQSPKAKQSAFPSMTPSTYI